LYPVAIVPSVAKNGESRVPCTIYRETSDGKRVAAPGTFVRVAGELTVAGVPVLLVALP
jgi:hypothetical protein